MKSFLILAISAIFLLVSAPARATLVCEQIFKVSSGGALTKNANSELAEKLLPIALEAGRKAGLSDDETRKNLDFYLKTGIIGGSLHIESLLFGDSFRQQEREDLDGLTEAKLAQMFAPYLAPGEKGVRARREKAVMMSRTTRANAFLRLTYTMKTDAPLGDQRAGSLLAALYERTMTDAMRTTMDAVPGRLAQVRYKAKKIGYKLFSKAAFAGVFIFPVAASSLHSWQLALTGFATAYTGIIADVVIRLKRDQRRYSLSREIAFERSRFLQIASRTDRWIEEEKMLAAPDITREELAPYNLGETYDSLTQNLRFQIAKSDMSSDYFSVNPTAEQIETITDDALSLAQLSIKTIEAGLERARLINEKRSSLQKFLAERPHAKSSVTESRVDDLNVRYNHRLEANDLDLVFSFETLTMMTESLRRARNEAKRLNDEPLVVHLESCLQKMLNREQELAARFAKR